MHIVCIYYSCLVHTYVYFTVVTLGMMCMFSLMLILIDWYNTWNEPMERVDMYELIITYSVWEIWLIKTDVCQPNTEMGQNMANDHQLFLALPIYGICSLLTHVYVCIGINIFKIEIS